jgi:hypothetical protein
MVEVENVVFIVGWFMHTEIANAKDEDVVLIL